MRMRPYTKQELAQLYFPDTPPHTAVNRLMRWINRCEPLREALEETHYQPRNRLFTPKQTALICQYLGEPDTDVR